METRLLQVMYSAASKQTRQSLTLSCKRRVMLLLFSTLTVQRISSLVRLSQSSLKTRTISTLSRTTLLTLLLLLQPQLSRQLPLILLLQRPPLPLPQLPLKQLLPALATESLSHPSLSALPRRKVSQLTRSRAQDLAEESLPPMSKSSRLQ